MSLWGRARESGVPTWGSGGGANGTWGWDLTDGDFPIHTLVSGNVMRENGVWEKQSSCIFSALSALSVWRENVCFNTPRAGFEFNDGMGGGDEVAGNLIFNS